MQYKKKKKKKLPFQIARNRTLHPPRWWELTVHQQKFSSSWSPSAEKRHLRYILVKFLLKGRDQWEIRWVRKVANIRFNYRSVVIDIPLSLNFTAILCKNLFSFPLAISGSRWRQSLKRTSITTIRDLFRIFPTFLTILCSHHPLPLIALDLKTFASIW